MKSNTTNERQYTSLASWKKRLATLNGRIAEYGCEIVITKPEPLYYRADVTGPGGFSKFAGEFNNGEGYTIEDIETP